MQSGGFILQHELQKSKGCVKIWRNYVFVNFQKKIFERTKITFEKHGENKKALW